ncbi:hypothetical protein [Dyadobacter sp. BHUBP1]|uniref:pPIWI-associating nuclease domain-containing protein n=1 Tax=Dyadobacter sp. BHUBP1 TaxID=3424178 RepID=UPI003D341826
MNPYQQMLALQEKFRQLNLNSQVARELSSKVGQYRLDVDSITAGQRAMYEAVAAFKISMRDANLFTKQVADSYQRVQDAISSTMGDSTPFRTQIKDIQRRMEESIAAAVAPFKNIDWVEVDRGYRENYHFHLSLLCELETANMQLPIDGNLLFSPQEEFSANYLEVVSNALRIHLDSDLYPLWEGAVISLASNNPDRVRHCFISIRTIIEYLANKVMNISALDVQQHADNKFDISKEPGIKLKLKAFFTKTEFDIVEEIGGLHVSSFCQYYAVLSGLHSPSARTKYSDDQVRVIMIKNGILIWAIVQREKLIQQVLAGSESD